MTAAGHIAAFSTGLVASQIPDDVILDAKLQILDTLGCGLAASALDRGTAPRSVLVADGGTPEATVIGSSARLPAASAAFANAVLCHALDYDGTHADSVAHIGVTVAPAAIAEAEALGASGAELLAAFVVGTEATARIGMAASGMFLEHGLHATSVCGVFGAAAAGARLRGLDARATGSALGLAGSMASGLLSFLDDGTETKPIHAGLAARAGILAARLADAGTDGPASVLEGRFGLYRALLGVDREREIAEQLEDLGTRWETRRIAYKPYPACHLIHGVLGAASSLLPQLGPDGAAAIEDVVAVVPAAAPPIVLEPIAAKFAPRTEYEGKFSLQFSLASLLVNRGLSLRTYLADNLADRRVLDLARRVRYETAEFPSATRSFPGGVRIRLADGTVLEASVTHQRGAPENPLAPAEIVEKFRDNASYHGDLDAAAALEQAVLGLEEALDVRSVFGHLGSKG